MSDVGTLPAWLDRRAATLAGSVPPASTLETALPGFCLAQSLAPMQRLQRLQESGLVECSAAGEPIYFAWRQFLRGRGPSTLVIDATDFDVRAIGSARVIQDAPWLLAEGVLIAAGLRDNGAGTLVGSELIEKKAATARKNLVAAGLDDLADIRTGDARQTLKDPGGPIEILLLDGGPALYAEILQMLVPNLRPGAVVIADNVDDEDHPYPTWVRDPAHGFVSSSIRLKGGTEYSIWTGTTTQRGATP